MIDYIRRSDKFILYLAIIFVIVLVVFPLILKNAPGVTWNDFIRNHRMQMFLAFLLAYALVYPFIAYTKIARHLNGSFSDNRKVFEKAFETLGYIVTSENEEKLVIRKKSQFARFVQWYEDGIVIQKSDNPVILSGMRKPVGRLDRFIDRLLISGNLA